MRSSRSGASSKDSAKLENKDRASNEAWDKRIVESNDDLLAAEEGISDPRYNGIGQGARIEMRGGRHVAEVEVGKTERGASAQSEGEGIRVERSWKSNSTPRPL